MATKKSEWYAPFVGTGVAKKSAGKKSAATPSPSFAELLGNPEVAAKVTFSANTVAKQILAAAAKARGEVEPKRPGGIAGQILAAAAKARGDE